MTFGFVLSTVNVTGSEVNGGFPARSVTTTRTWVGPSGEPTEFQWPANGAAVEASTWTKLDEPTVFTSNDTPPFGRPIPAVTSCATAARSIIPPSTAFAVGEVTDALSGEALSTVFCESRTCVALPVVSVTTSFRS